MRNLSINAVRSIFAKRTHIVVTPAISIEHPDLGVPLNWVNIQESASNISIEASGMIFTAGSFNVALPQDIADTIPSVELQIFMPNYSLVRAIRATTISPDVKLYILSWEANKIPDQYNKIYANVEIGPLNFKVRQYRHNDVEITFTLGYEEEYLSMSAVKDKFTPTIAPALFK